MKYLAIHHTSVSREIQPSQFYAVNRYHKKLWNMKSTLGWYTGYNYFMGTNGVITQTRKVGEETMAIKGHNKDTIHVCLAGDFNFELPTVRQRGNLMEFIDKIKEDYPKIKVKLHSELQKNRTCAGSRFTKAYLNELILDKKELNIDDTDTDKHFKIIEMQSMLDRLMETLRGLLAQLRR